MCGTEAEVVTKAISGDSNALSLLLKERIALLHNLLHGRIPRRWQPVLSVEDVIQETLADAFHDIGRFNPNDHHKLTSWLKNIAECNLRDALRMLEAQKRGGDHRRADPSPAADSRTTLLDVLSASGTTPSKCASDKEALAALEKAIKSLPPDYRRVVQLFDLEGRPIESVAEALGRSRGAVYMLRARAHDWLRESMGDTDNFFSDSA